MPPNTPRFRADPALPEKQAKSLWLAFRDAEILVRTAPAGAPWAYEVPELASLSDLALSAVRTQPLGWLDDKPCRSAELPRDAEAPAGYTFASLRRIFGRMDPAHEAAAGTAFQIQYWDKTNQFCGECGGPLELDSGHRAKRCPRDHHQFFPRITPAIIVLVEDDDHVLLTRQPRFPAGMYGLVAGFVEPGETFEACVERETREETGLFVSDIAYFGSQPWPYPHQIMVGFFAKRAGGELIVDKNELEEAAFFQRDALPALPPPLSIARKLIDAWLARKR